MKVVEYGRISTDKQTLEQQNRTVQEWLKRNGLKSDIVITEEGISGGCTSVAGDWRYANSSRNFSFRTIYERFKQTHQ